MAADRYRITERVASGGMAEVFRGFSESIQGFKKNVAIKRILPSLTKNKKFVAMFLDEARLSLTLQHANIVPVFDIGHADATYFIVMEYVDGVDLKSIIEWRRRIGKPLPIAQTIYIAMEMCKALAYAHDIVHPETGKPLGIVHRDVSPPNVLISKQGEVKVVDFGLAKATSQVEITDPGVVKGKMSYLSPEAARGEEVDLRADIFAVGIILYEMLTGRRLFYGETDYQTVELVRNSKVPPISAQNQEVEPELEDVVRKALARRVDDRFQSAEDLQDALAHYTYSRGLKVISRNISEVVRQCLEDRATQSGAGKKATGNLIDTLLQEEIVKFTSVEFEAPGARPISPGELGGVVQSTPNPTGDYVDPRSWTADMSSDFSAAFLKDKRPTPVVPAPAPGSPQTMAAQAAAARGAAPSETKASGSTMGGPTPGPSELVGVLEPGPSRPMLIGGRRGKGLVIGLVICVVVLGAAFAALVVKAGL